MGCRSLLSAMALVASLGLAGMPVVAQQTASSDRVLAQKADGFNPAAVQAMINRGDTAAAAGDLAKARQEYDNARKASKQLLAFYRDLSGAFRGLDARIPREMDTKGREALGLLAEADLRLAALFRRQNQPEVAVPVLVEVVKLMTRRDIRYRSLSASRYAQGLHKGVRPQDPGRLIDTLIIGALIEARSCERFARLAPELDDELGEFYRSLLKSEARHFGDYLRLAEGLCDKEHLADRLDHFRLLEADLVQGADTEFRFHSGPVSDVMD